MLRPFRQYSIHMETAPLPVRDCKVSAFVRNLPLLSKKSTFTQDLGFCSFIQRTMDGNTNDLRTRPPKNTQNYFHSSVV